MDKYIVYEEIDKDRCKVTKIIERPTDEQLEELSFYIDASEIPVADPPKGMQGRLMIRLPERELYYDYESFPESKVEQLELENMELKLAIAELAEMNQKDKTETQLALTELAELIAGTGGEVTNG
ncbi:hypothetical protein [Paenibacillus massiliensis]|uniref:hypothetical protein n=1 Tax=Paenibacillus massiliensis TaxID=225917 RepID=UPI000403C05A|nr:hypothetical protein [Paenibacillus massiliensis]